MKVQILLSGLVLSLAAPCFSAPHRVVLASRSNTVCPPTSEAPGLNALDLDVVLERLDEDGQSIEDVGERIVKDDARQTLASVLSPDQTQNYLIRIKNTGQSVTTFRVSLGGLLSATGEETVWEPKGWAGLATVDGQTTDIISALKSKQGWETPRINAGEEAVIRLSLTAPAQNLPLTDGSFRVVARKDTQSDAVVGHVGPQFIAKLQWTMDADETHTDRWHDVDEKTVVQIDRFDTLGIRAIKAVPSAPWVDEEALGPKWTFQGTKYEGDDVWIGPEHSAPSGAPVTATMGNSITFQVRVLPDAFVTLDADAGYAVLPANATQTQSRLLTVKVENEDEEPLPNVKVRFRAFKGETAVASSWTPAGQDKATQGTDEFLTTNEQGEVQVHWTAKAGVVSVGDKITFKAEVVDEGGRTFGSPDTFNIEVYDKEVE